MAVKPAIEKMSDGRGRNVRNAFSCHLQGPFRILPLFKKRKKPRKAKRDVVIKTPKEKFYLEGSAIAPHTAHKAIL